MKFLLVAILFTFALIQAIKAKNCSVPADCQPDECCRIGMERYSIPSCRKFGEEGGYCRRNSQGRDVTLHYPNGWTIEAKNIYTLFCPCKANLQCTKGACQ